jgi:hypothetical protein
MRVSNVGGFSSHKIFTPSSFIAVNLAFNGYFDHRSPLSAIRSENDPSQGVIMGVVGATVRGVGKTVGRAADATTAAAGAVGGAAVNGIVGGVTGAAEGIKRGVGSGSHSTPAAALAIGALGVAGLVEWPVLLAVGGGALLLHRMLHKPDTAAAKANLKPVPSESAPQKAVPAKTPSKPAKKASGRRAGATGLRSTN